ncbi:PKD domain-containing protein [Bernardetia sp.]|uniref:PKD domain-containing protein n=1 Tax=Bernardetia sp. TaxID=1937974 RepID=UPI0025C55002|nr:PKD domain-containing protein [Bernardetia sp.]
MLSKLSFKIFFALIFTTLILSSCKKNNELPPDVVISFDESPEGYSINEVVTFTNTSQHADKDSYRWTIQRLGVNFIGDIDTELLLDSSDEDIQFTFPSVGFYRVTLTGSNSNSFGQSQRTFNF